MRWFWASPQRETDYPLSSDELTLLATFNSERHRGLVHTQEYTDRMSQLQKRHNAWVEEQNRVSGYDAWLRERNSRRYGQV